MRLVSVFPNMSITALMILKVVFVRSMVLGGRGFCRQVLCLPRWVREDSNVIGYELCYDDAECPILEVECVQIVEIGLSEDELA